MNMLRFLKPITAFCFLLLAAGLSAQDSLNALPGWKTASKRTAEGKYELVFTLSNTSGWQVYVPNQVFNDAKMADLVFADSAIQVTGRFKENGIAKTIEHPFFGPGVLVYEENIEWR